jgi:hypothetical protein
MASVHGGHGQGAAADFLGVRAKGTSRPTPFKVVRAQPCSALRPRPALQLRAAAAGAQSRALPPCIVQGAAAGGLGCRLDSPTWNPTGANRGRLKHPLAEIILFRPFPRPVVRQSTPAV